MTQLAHFLSEFHLSKVNSSNHTGHTYCKSSMFLITAIIDDATAFGLNTYKTYSFSNLSTNPKAISSTS